MHPTRLPLLLLMALSSPVILLTSAQICPPTASYYLSSIQFEQRYWSAWVPEFIEAREVLLYVSKFQRAPFADPSVPLDARDVEQWYGSRAKTAPLYDTRPRPQFDEWTAAQPVWSTNRTYTIEDRQRDWPPQFEFKFWFPRLPYGPRSKEPGDGLPPRFVEAQFALRGVEPQPGGELMYGKETSASILLDCDSTFPQPARKPEDISVLCVNRSGICL